MYPLLEESGGYGKICQKIIDKYIKKKIELIFISIVHPDI